MNRSARRGYRSFLAPILLLSIGLGNIPGSLWGQAVPSSQPILRQAANDGDAEDLTAFNSADKLWLHLEDLKNGPQTQPKNREEALATVRTYLHRLEATAGEFTRRYPKDPRRWDANLLSLQLSETLARVEPERDGPDDAEKEITLRAIAYAADAPPHTKADALYALIALIPDRMERVEGSDSTLAELEGEISLFEKEFPEDPRREAVGLDRAQLLQRTDPAKARALLEKLSKSENGEIAEEAGSRLVMAGLRDKPLDLRFTAVDGQEFDLAKLRGKVVLVDFWATWCGPCVEKIPELTAAYGKLHDRGLEIVGISLDQKKESLLAMTKARGMPWPEYFDGKGWENEIAARYSIRAIPRAFLVNKKGFVVNPDAGKNLAMEIEKLLAEP